VLRAILSVRIKLMFKKTILFFVLVSLLFLGGNVVHAQTQDATQLVLDQVKPLSRSHREEGLIELKSLLNEQELGAPLFNPLKYTIRTGVNSGMPIDTVVLLLLLPVVAAVISAARHLVGIQGFGILLPAALSVSFVATGPVVGIGLFLVIVFISTAFRIILRKLKVKLQYLPRMSLILWLVVLGMIGILFSGPLLAKYPDIVNISIFPVLILVLLAEDFARVQLGKSVRVAISLTSETLFLALMSFAILQLEAIQRFALLNPEILFITVAIFDIFLGRYAGLRLLELWRFRKLILSK